MSRSERLVGRGHALDVVRSALGEAVAGNGQFVLVTGEAGIGKSAVLGALAEEAAQGCTVLRAFCWDGTGVPPYWPWSQVLRAAGLPAAELGEGARLVDADAVPTEGDAAAADERFRLFDAVGRCLIGLAARRPVAVMLDDLQWADDSSLDLLSFLVRALSGSPVLLAGAYRDTETPARLHDVAATAQQVALPGLSPGEVGSMVAALSGAAPASEVAEQLCRRTGGNPFFVRELTRLMQAHGAGTQLPVGVIEAVRRRLARLSTDCVRLLDWAAVAGREIDVGLLVDAAAVADEQAATDLLGQARQAGVVAGSGFMHDLYREAIRDGLSTSTRAAINHAIGRALQARGSDAARIAAHLNEAGPVAQDDAIEYSIRAAREASARLGYDEACAHYLRVVELISGDERRLIVLLELAAAHARAGDTGAAMRRYREAADASTRTRDAVTFARAALGMQALGHRSGAQDSDVVDALQQAATWLPDRDAAALKSRVLAALARARRHGSMSGPDPEVAAVAERAAQLASAAGDADALAAAKLAVHDALWTLGSAAARLPVLAEMLAAATAAGSAELIAEAHLLHSTALLELGDPAGREELRAYVRLAENLGHARGRWRALTRRATLAQIASRAEEAAALGEEAFELGRAIGEPDALGCFCTFRWSLVALGVREPDVAMEAADPMWPMFPLIAAWPHAVRGDLDAARGALGDFSVLDVPVWTGLESLAVAAVVFAAVGSDEHRRWAYKQLLPHAGTHVVVGGCASYHAAVDHHLGALAAALDDTAAAEKHFRAAIAMHEQIGAAGWKRLSEVALAELPLVSANEFRPVDGRWQVRYASTAARLDDVKGLHDLWTLLRARGAEVHCRTLVGLPLESGADRVLDDTAEAAYRARLRQLNRQIDDADELGHTERADRLREERSALAHELAAAIGLGGRPRRLGDDSERARKTVSARVRDALTKMDAVHPQLAAHLRAAMHLGSTCRYAPTEPTSWRLD
jgi:tetratricopeptide (TPR) repeat protein